MHQERHDRPFADLVTTHASWCVAVGGALLTAVAVPVLLLDLAGVPGLEVPATTLVLAVGAVFLWLVALELRAERGEEFEPAPAPSRAAVRTTIAQGSSIVTYAVLDSLERSALRR